MSLQQQFDAQCAALGADLWGVADVSDLFAGRWSAWPRAISVAVRLSPEALQGVAFGPTPAYYTAYQEANRRLDALARALAAWIVGQGYEAEAYAATVGGEALDAVQGLAATVQHKTVATRAGLGWIGRSTLLVTPSYGPAVRLSSVLTDLPLPSAVPVERDRCGDCRRCVQACPAGAILGEAWQAGTRRDALLDAVACRRQAEALLLDRVGARNAVCGVCVAVCPFSRLARDDGAERGSLAT